jgi:hypothetical protein
VTALNKMVAAMEAGAEPAAGTYRDALAELDAHLHELEVALRDGLILRGRLQTYIQVSSVLRELKSPPVVVAPVSELRQAQSRVVLCEICGAREGRLQDDGVWYCKRCARDKGVIVHGKI